jgi:hypothetical protein
MDVVQPLTEFARRGADLYPYRESEFRLEDQLFLRPSCPLPRFGSAGRLTIATALPQVAAIDCDVTVLAQLPGGGPCSAIRSKRVRFR